MSGTVTADSLTAAGTADGTGSITVNKTADISGSLTAGTLTLAEGSKSTVNGTVTADSLTAAGTAEGSGKITVKKGADVSGSLTAGTLTLEEGSVSDVTGSVTAENLTASGTVGGSGKFAVNGKADISGEFAAERICAKSADISGKLAAGDAVLGNATVAETGTLTAKSLTSVGSLGGSGKIEASEKFTMENGSAILKGASVTAADAAVPEESSAAADGSLSADNLTVSGTVTGSGSITAKEKADISGSLTAGSFSARSADITGSLSAKDAVLGDSTVTGTVTAESLTASGTISGSGSVTAEKTLVLGGDFTLGNIASLTAGTADFGGYSAMLVNTSGSAPTVLTMTGLSSSGTDGVLSGGLTAGSSSAFYIGDTKGGSELFRTEVKEVEGKSLKALGFIDKKVTLAKGSSITVDGTLTKAPSASAVSSASAAVSSWSVLPVYVLNGAQAKGASAALVPSAASASSSYADTVTVGKGSKLTVSAAALEGGAAVIFEKGGKVHNSGTIEITKTDVAANDVIPVFGAKSGTVTDSTLPLGGEYTMLGGAFILDPLGNGSVLARCRGIQDEGVESSVKDPVNSWIEAGGTVEDGSFLSDAMSSEESAKAFNSAARFSVLSGTIQNSLLAGKASYDSVSERLGFGAASIARQGTIEGTSAGVWLQPVYMHYDSDGLSAGLTGDYGISTGLYGTVLGADVKFGGSYIVGASFSTGSGTSHSEGSHSYTKNDFDFWGGSIYGSMEFGDFTLAADTGITKVTGDAEQTSPIGKLKGDADADVWTAGVQARYDIKAGKVKVSPHAGVRCTKVSTKASDVRTEKGAAIRTGKVTVEQETFPVGVKVSSDFKAGDWSLSPAADASLIFTAGDRDVTTHTNLGGPEVSAASDISDSVSWDVKAGLNAEYKDRLGLGISAGFGGSEHTDSEARVSLGVRFEF